MAKKKKILNTVICYNNAEEVVSYALSLSKLEGSSNVCLVITLNSIQENQKVDLQKKINDINLEIIIYDPNKNIGYMNGMIQGYDHYKELTDGHTPEYIIMSNTDINYPDHRIISKLLSNKYDGDTWVIGPAVFAPLRMSYDNPIKEHRRSANEIDSLIKKFGIPFFSEIYVVASLLKGRLLRKKVGNSRKVYEVHGCYFIIRGMMGNKLLESPFGALLYSEETYIAEIAYKNGKVAYYDTSLLVYHIEHTVTSRISAKKIAKHLYDSMKVIKKDFY